MKRMIVKSNYRIFIDEQLCSGDLIDLVIQKMDRLEDKGPSDAFSIFNLKIENGIYAAHMKINFYMGPVEVRSHGHSLSTVLIEAFNKADSEIFRWKSLRFLKQPDAL